MAVSPSPQAEMSPKGAALPREAPSPAAAPVAEPRTGGFPFTARLGNSVAIGALIFIPILLAFWGNIYLNRAQRPIDSLIRTDDGSPDIATALVWSRGPNSRLLVGTQSGRTFRISPDGSVGAKVQIGNDDPVMQIQPTGNLEHYDLMLGRNAFTEPDRGGRLLTLYQTIDGHSQRSSFSAFSRGLVATLASAGGTTLYSATRMSPSLTKQASAASSITALAKWEKGNKEAVLVRTDPAQDITRLISFGKSYDPTTDRLAIGDADGNVAIVDEDPGSGANTVTFVGRHGGLTDPKAQSNPTPANRIIALSATTLAELDIPVIASAAADGSIKVWSRQGGSGSGFVEDALAAFAPGQVWAPVVPLHAAGGSELLSASGDLSQIALRQLDDSPKRGKLISIEENPAMGLSIYSFGALHGALARFSQDEVMIVDGDQAILYKRDGGQPKASFGEKGDPIRVAVFNNTGQQVAVAADSKSTRIYETSTGRLFKALPVENAPITALAFDSTSTWLATGLENGHVEVRNIDDLQSFSLAVTPNTAISQVGFSADGKRLLTIDASGSFRSFSVRSLKPLVFLPNSFGSAGVVSRSGAFLAYSVSTQTGAEIQIVDTATGAVISRIPTGSRAASSTTWVSDDGNTAALAETGGNLLLWKKTAATDTETALPPVAADGLTLSSLGTPLLVREPSGALYVSTWSSEVPYRLRPVPLTVPAVQATLSEDGSEIIAACIDGLIRIIPAESTDPTRTLEISGHGDMVTHIALSPDNRYLASASIDGRVRITDLDWAKWLGGLPLSWLPANLPPEPMKPQRLDGQFRPTDNQPPQTTPAGTVRQQPATAN